MQGLLEHYRTFYTIVKTGSITAAATELSVSQPAVSQQMSHLEQSLGARLLIRSSRGIRLTREGQLLYSYVSKGMDQLLLGEQKLSQMMNLDIGELHIGASDMTLHFYLLPYLEKFHEQHPGIKIVVTNGPTPETMQNLQQGSIDFGIVSGPIRPDDDVKAVPVRTIHDVFVAGSAYRHLQGKQLPLRELTHLPLICLEESTSSRRAMDRFLETHRITVSPEIELATSDMIVQFAIRNLGIGCVVSDFAQEAIQKGELFQLDLAQEIPPRQFILIRKKDDILPQAAKGLIELILEENEAGKA